MKKYLRSKRHIKAQELVIVGRERKKANRLAREIRLMSRLALGVGSAIATWAQTAAELIRPFESALANIAKSLAADETFLKSLRDSEAAHE